jgi:hypothetical protein
MGSFFREQPSGRNLVLSVDAFVTIVVADVVPGRDHRGALCQNQLCFHLI